VKQRAILESPMYEYEITVWEKAEHWQFYETIKADSESDARARALKLYPVRSYVIRHIHRIV
jgi:hypothetical protein